MAKTPPRITQDDEMPYHTPASRAGIRFIRSLDDDDVLTAARDPFSAQHAAVTVATGPGPVSRAWVTSCCADEAYERGLIDETEYDRLSA